MSDARVAPSAGGERAEAEGKVSRPRPSPSASSRWMLCAPAVIAMLLVTAYPIIYAVVLSLQDVDLRFPDEGGFVGLDNYVDRAQLEPVVAERRSTPSSSPSSRSRSSSCSG